MPTERLHGNQNARSPADRPGYVLVLYVRGGPIWQLRATFPARYGGQGQCANTKASNSASPLAALNVRLRLASAAQAEPREAGAQERERAGLGNTCCDHAMPANNQLLVRRGG